MHRAPARKEFGILARGDTESQSGKRSTTYHRNNLRFWWRILPQRAAVFISADRPSPQRAPEGRWLRQKKVAPLPSCLSSPYASIFDALSCACSKNVPRCPSDFATGHVATMAPALPSGFASGGRRGLSGGEGTCSCGHRSDNRYRRSEWGSSPRSTLARVRSQSAGEGSTRFEAELAKCVMPAGPQQEGRSTTSYAMLSA